MRPDLVGKKFTFDDGDSLEIIQIKHRGNEEYLVTYLVCQGRGVPRKLVSPLQEFLGNYGHLFGESTETKPE